MHKNELYFGGFTPDDLFITDSGKLKMSNVFVPCQSNIEKFSKNPYYCPTERIKQLNDSSREDFYSLGILILALLQ
jgi:serine/threonine protein kinase